MRDTPPPREPYWVWRGLLLLVAVGLALLVGQIVCRLAHTVLLRR